MTRTHERKVDVVFNELRDRLARGHYSFGQTISVRDLALELNVSRFPVMSALNELRAAGFVSIIPQIGCRVISPTREEVSDFFLLFSQMEGVVFELAAARRPARDLGSLRRIFEGIRSLGGVADVGEVYRLLNRQFHQLIHTWANSPNVTRKAQENWALSDFFISQANVFKDQPSAASLDYEELVAAIESADPPRARQSVEKRIRDTGQRVVKAMP
jgi:DNA-binding GntR family transcriptional regulator